MREWEEDSLLNWWFWERWCLQWDHCWFWEKLFIFKCLM